MGDLRCAGQGFSEAFLETAPPDSPGVVSLPGGSHSAGARLQGKGASRSLPTLLR